MQGIRLLLVPTCKMDMMNISNDMWKKLMHFISVFRMRVLSYLYIIQYSEISGFYGMFTGNNGALVVLY